MKLILITAIREFEKKIKDILVHSELKAFSYVAVNGFQNLSSQDVEENWFAGDMQQNESVMFIVFSPTEKVNTVLEKFKKINSKQEFNSSIHAMALNIETAI